MAKLYIEATNLLKFCMAGSDGLDLALGAGAVGVGSKYTWSAEGLLAKTDKTKDNF